MDDPELRKDASAARATIIIVTFISIALALIAISFALINWININLLAYNIFIVGLWILWIICGGYRPVSLFLLYATAAFTGIMFILDVVFSIRHLIIAYNCLVAGVDCPAPPDDGNTIAALALVEAALVVITLLIFLSLLTLIYAKEQHQRNKIEDNPLLKEKNS